MNATTQDLSREALISCTVGADREGAPLFTVTISSRAGLGYGEGFKSVGEGSTYFAALADAALTLVHDAELLNVLRLERLERDAIDGH